MPVPGGSAGQATGLEGDEEEKPGPGGRYKVLTGPDALQNLDKLDKLDKFGKEKQKPPIEFFRTQVAPFDLLPFVKPRHWTTLGQEIKANYNDYEGRLQTPPVLLQGQPNPEHEVVYSREARLLKKQQTQLGLQVMFPDVPRQMSLELARPDSVRPDEVSLFPLRMLETHQMLVVVLAKNANDYGSWNKLQALLPSAGDRDPASIDRKRYYRMVIPDDSAKPLLSAHPLTWTTISHIIWDGFEPDALNTAQQQAMLDWLHWGGQLIIVGGAGPTLAPLKESFLGPDLPADPAGENALLTGQDLAPLSEAYRPPVPYEEQIEAEADPSTVQRPLARYRDAAPIHPAPNRPVYFAGLRMRDNLGAVEIPLAEGSKRLLGVERRIGRGRILMLSFTPTDPAIASWPGVDTLVRRLILRRPEEQLRRQDQVPPGGVARGSRGGSMAGAVLSGATPPPSANWTTTFLPGPDLTWVRYLSRDLGAVPTESSRPSETGEPPLPADPVAEWNDRSALPTLCQVELKAASGITVPGSSFVVRVMLAYIIALVPANWLLCRFVFRRREWAWALVPVLALGFAIGVERAAAYDLGFDSGCDEVDLLETYAHYPRAHVSRFAALFSTGRVRYDVSYPEDRSALALPMSAGDALRGETVAQSVWQSLPVPALLGLQVQPRSLILFRAEQMANMPGTIELVTDQGPRRVVNGTSLELRDAVLVDGERRLNLGTIPPGGSIELAAAGAEGAPSKSTPAEKWLDPEKFLNPLRKYERKRPEDQGEIRLVAWAPKFLPGQKVEPQVDRHRGMTLVVAHLDMGPPPSPDDPRYDSQTLTVDTSGYAAPAGAMAAGVGMTGAVPAVGTAPMSSSMSGMPAAGTASMAPMGAMPPAATATSAPAGIMPASVTAAPAAGTGVPISGPIVQPSAPGAASNPSGTGPGAAPGPGPDGP